MERPDTDSLERNSSQQSDLLEFERVIRDVPRAIQTKLKLANVFSSIHRKMNEGIPYQQILDSIFDSLEQIIPFHRIGIALLENNGKDIRLNWVKSKLQSTHLGQNYAAPLGDSSLQKVIITAKPRIINDLQNYLRENPHSKSTQLILKDGIRSSLTCPLIVNKAPIGVIFFSSAEPNTYQKLHVDVFCEITGGLSIIIEQALLKKSIQKTEEKEKMFRNTLHDLNNPLWVIQTVLEMLTRKPWFKDLSNDTQRVFMLLKRNTDNMIKLVQDLVYTVKEEKGDETEESEDVPTQSFMRDVLADARVMAMKKNIQVNLNVHDHIPTLLKFDAHKVKQVLDNLIANAIKFNSEDTHVTVKVQFDKNAMRLKFFVVDEGPGIPHEYLSKLFKEPIKIKSMSATEKSSGRGLLNVKRLVQSLGGEVSVESRVGEGSIFHFWIPTKDSDQKWH